MRVASIHSRKRFQLCLNKFLVWWKTVKIIWFYIQDKFKCLYSLRLSVSIKTFWMCNPKSLMLQEGMTMITTVYKMAPDINVQIFFFCIRLKKLSSLYKNNYTKIVQNLFIKKLFLHIVYSQIIQVLGFFPQTYFQILLYI